jgi:hypothetical protein
MNIFRKHFITDFAPRFGKCFTIGVLAAMSLVTPRLARANEIFGVDLAIGNGSVIGTITTDGTLGTIGQSDIVGLDLTINAPIGSAIATNTTDFYAFSGDDLSETASDLLFDFSASSGGGFTILSDDSSEAWSVGEGSFLQSICTATCDPGDTPGIEDDSRTSPMYYTELTGNVAIATAPEPCALWLLSTGLVALGALRIRRGGRLGNKED